MSTSVRETVEARMREAEETVSRELRLAFERNFGMTRSELMVHNLREYANLQNDMPSDAIWLRDARCYDPNRLGCRWVGRVWLVLSPVESCMPCPNCGGFTFIAEVANVQFSDFAMHLVETEDGDSGYVSADRLAELEREPRLWHQEFLNTPQVLKLEPGTYCARCNHDGGPWIDDGPYTPERYRGRPCCPTPSCNCADHMTAVREVT